MRWIKRSCYVDDVVYRHADVFLDSQTGDHEGVCVGVKVEDAFVERVCQSAAGVGDEGFVV